MVNTGASVQVWSASQVEQGDPPPEHRDYVSQILAWANGFLLSPHPDLGRSGPVCPYTRPALRKDLFYLAAGTGTDVTAMIEDLRTVHGRLSQELDDTDRELLTVVLVLPHLDHGDPAVLDELQAAAKERFVSEGLMIGQFHPLCDEPGLWNPRFRPLRTPIPALAIRQMTVYDLPFVIDVGVHVDSYLQRFTPELPTRIRAQLVTRLATPQEVCPV